MIPAPKYYLVDINGEIVLTDITLSQAMQLVPRLESMCWPNDTRWLLYAMWSNPEDRSSIPRKVYDFKQGIFIDYKEGACPWAILITSTSS
jgi:hypothetical protein